MTRPFHFCLKVFAISALVASSCVSSASAEPLLGHNLTPTSNTLNAGQTMIGTYAIAYGFTDSLTVGTSPWLIVQYNMPAISVKYAFPVNEVITRLQIEQLYLKTFDFGWDRYKQESIWTRITASHRFDEHYTLHVNYGFQYFWDDTVAFSMRPTPVHHTPVTMSFSTLSEISFTDQFGIFAEAGILGLNYSNKYLQVGLSGFWKWSTGYIQLGVSRSYEIGPEYTTLADYTEWTNMYGVDRHSIFKYTRNPFHPELQLEFLF